ncbi:MAG: polysaccharide chain length determinant protein (PEP-CTERM system associated) [Psychromonas sp.]|jgi:polysaccharide chain length determinant protein (PEP-CTERM system associated)|uniref:XrtA system polysaccharide chain length determinant n=1 Tax=Psychromonas sp. TaxID=1884585 RepID=UPI0039E4DC27
MELNEIFKYITVIWHEICLRKFKAAILVTLVSFAVLGVGVYKPSVFKSEVTIYADTQNVIKPLLGKQTAVTNVKENRAAQIRDIIYSPRQLNKVIDHIYGKNAFPDAASLENKLTNLRQNLKVEGQSGNYIKISYQDNSPDRTFRLLNEVVLLFVEDSASTKRDESRSAYNFIEQQVDSYKAQLLLAEDKLKNFKSTHLDGTESEVESRISTLRNNIEDMKIQQMESLTRISSLKTQLYSQDKFSSNDYEASLYHSKLKALQQHLDNLLLTYKDDYPEVIEVRYQISDIKNTIKNLAENKKETVNVGNEFNPLYQEISSKLSTAQVSHNTIKNRLSAFQVLLEEAYERRKRIANNQAELSELNRDNSVVKALYEDMLANKEKARLSMVLDIEGQGVNYKIQEPATYPTVPSGPRFLHFLIAGPILGLGCLIILFIAKILLDNKIRFASQLESFTGVPLLVSISHTLNRSERKRRRINNITLTFYLLSTFTIYVAVAIAHKYDIPIDELLTTFYSRLMELMR